MQKMGRSMQLRAAGVLPWPSATFGFGRRAISSPLLGHLARPYQNLFGPNANSLQGNRIWRWRQATRVQNPLQTIPKKYFPLFVYLLRTHRRRFLRWLVIGLLVYLVAVPGYRLYLETREFVERLDYGTVIQKATLYLEMVVIRFVFHNNDLTTKVVNLLDRVIASEKIIGFFREQLTRLLASDMLLRNTTQLVNEKLLIQNVLVDLEIQGKLRDIIRRVMRNPSVRDSLTDLIVDLIQSPMGYEFMVDNIKKGFLNTGVQDKFAQEIIHAIYGQAEQDKSTSSARQEIMGKLSDVSLPNI